MTDTDKETIRSRQGWGWPLNAKKAHYFNNEIVSLCGRWMYTGSLEDFGDNSSDNCAECCRRIKKLRAETSD